MLGTQIRNAKRKNKRLKDKANNLSTEDLMTLWMAKGGGRQSIAEANASSSNTGKPSFSGDISEVLATNAACIANSAPVQNGEEREDVEL